jgi:hypothetical protein
MFPVAAIRRIPGRLIVIVVRPLTHPAGIINARRADGRHYASNGPFQRVTTAGAMLRIDVAGLRFLAGKLQSNILFNGTLALLSAAAGDKLDCFENGYSHISMAA